MPPSRSMRPAVTKPEAKDLRSSLTPRSQEHLADRIRRFVVMAPLSLDGDMDQLFMFAKKSAIALGWLRLMSHYGDDRGELAAAYLPDMQIGHDRIAIAFDRAMNLVGEIGGGGRYIQQHHSRIAKKGIGPGEDDATADDTD